jgi:CheY-specific phosphatase CheX
MFCSKRLGKTMIEDLRAKMIAAVSKVFETMFFIYPELREESEKVGQAPSGGEMLPGEPGQEPLVTFLKNEIGFHGESSGRIKLYVPYELATQMAANFMGLEEKEVGETQALDMGGELINMIAGNLFSILGKKRSYHMGVPSTEIITESQIQDGLKNSGTTLNFDVEGQAIILSIQ